MGDHSSPKLCCIAWNILNPLSAIYQQSLARLKIKQQCAMIIIAGGRISDSKRTKQSFTENGHRVTNKHLESLSGNDLEECVFMATVNVALKPGVVNANVWRSFSIASL